MATITIISNDLRSRCHERTELSMQEQAHNMRYDYPIETMRTSNSIVMSDVSGFRCIVQESRRG